MSIWKKKNTAGTSGEMAEKLYADTVKTAEELANMGFDEAFAEAFEEQKHDMGRFNLAVFGKSGVGKSTLINQVFGKNVAATGIGKPVTEGAHLYVHDSGFLGIYDTQGLEIGVDGKKILKELKAYIKSNRKGHLNHQIHVIWYCVRATGHRFESYEADFIRELHELGLPVLCVLTQVARVDGQPHPDAVALAQHIESLNLPLADPRVYLTLALDDEFTQQKAHGAKDLVDATFRVIPEGAQAALDAAQVVDAERKWKSAESVTLAAAAAAAAAGASPIPFSDAAILVPIQMGMMAKISNIYGMSATDSKLAATAATAAATNLGRTVVLNLVKFVPGANVGALAISATVAATLTTAMGYAWASVCVKLTNDEVTAKDTKAIREMFLTELKKQVKIVRKDKPSAARQT